MTGTWLWLKRIKCTWKKKALKFFFHVKIIIKMWYVVGVYELSWDQFSFVSVCNNRLWQRWFFSVKEQSFLPPIFYVRTGPPFSKMCSLSHRVEACKNFRTVCSFVDLALSHLGHHKIRKFKSKRSNSSPFYFPKPRWFYCLFIWRVIGLSNDCNFVSFYFQMGGSVKNWKNF